MPRHSPYAIALTDEERQALDAKARAYTSPYCEVIRAKIVLLAAQGLRNDEIAARLDTPRQVVSKWRKRFHEQRLAVVNDVAKRLGLREGTVRTHIHNILEKTGARSQLEAVALARDEGLIP